MCASNVHHSMCKEKIGFEQCVCVGGGVLLLFSDALARFAHSASRQTRFFNVPSVKH